MHNDSGSSLKRAAMNSTLKSLFISLVFIVLATTPSAAEDNLLSVNAGIFMPGDNYDGSYDSMGGSLGFSFLRVNEYAGLEVGLASYHLGSSYNDTTAIGLEMLVHFQKQDFDRFQPFIAFGIGVHATDFGYPGGTLSDTGTGFVLKAGFRHFLDISRSSYSFEKDKYFVGAYLKHFSNNILDNRALINVADLDVGGQCLCFEVGVWTD
jgi:hypothetical protein